MSNKNKSCTVTLRKEGVLKINTHYSSFENFEKLLQKENALAKEIAKNHIFFKDYEKFVKILRGTINE